MSSTHYANKQLLRKAVETSAETMTQQRQQIQLLEQTNASLQRMLHLKVVECNLLELQLKLAGVPVR